MKHKQNTILVRVLNNLPVRANFLVSIFGAASVDAVIAKEGGQLLAARYFSSRRNHQL